MAFMAWTRSAVTRGLSVPLWTRGVSVTSSTAAQSKTTKAEDPIQKLFVEKLREYGDKSKGGKLPEASPQFMAKHKEELERVKRQYGGGDLESFPKLEFKD
jgi:F-type H+-transporting ATPase subunit 6